MSKNPAADSEQFMVGYENESYERVLKRQEVGGDENPERLSCHESEDEALLELASYAPE